MKKILLLAAFAVTALTSKAQYEPGRFSIQPRIGTTVAWISNTPDIPMRQEIGTDLKAQPTGGFIIGVEGEYQITKLVSASVGVNWAQAGTGWKDYIRNIGGVRYEMTDAKIETSYINIPLKAKFYVVDGLSLHTGVQFSFLTSADIMAKMTETLEGKYSDKQEYDNSMKDLFNKFDLAIPIGVSYEFDNHIVIDGTYNIGLLKINKESEPGFKDNRNQVFSLTVGYKFGL